MSAFQIRQCSNAECRFRFPWTATDPPKLRCPNCGSVVQVMITQQNEAEQGQVGRRASALPIQGLLDNVRSAFNVGSIFRCADGVGIEQLYLCGITPTPNHPKVAKTALGAEQNISWHHANNALEVAYHCQAQGQQLWALEETAQAEALFAAALPPVDAPIVLVVGNEVTGVDPELLALCDRVLAIPMRGSKRSLNVAIAFGIAAYWLCAR